MCKTKDNNAIKHHAIAYYGWTPDLSDTPFSLSATTTQRNGSSFAVMGHVMGNERLPAYLLSKKLASNFWTIRVVEE